MRHFITITGPQSSGKSTALKHLQKKYRDWYFIEEINPYTVAGANHLGGAFVDRDLEISLVKIELTKIRAVKNTVHNTIVTETGIGHTVYTQFFAGQKIADQFYNDYLDLYQALNPFLIFIETPPNISFSRRKKKYEERIAKKGITEGKNKAEIMKKYRDTILKLYPLWTKFYNKFPYPKAKIDNSLLSEKKFIHELDMVIDFLLSQKSSR